MAGSAKLRPLRSFKQTATSLQNGHFVDGRKNPAQRAFSAI